MSKVPATTKTPPKVTVPRSLVEQTVQVLLQIPAAQVYLLVREWEQAVPDLLVPQNTQGAQP